MKVRDLLQCTKTFQCININKEITINKNSITITTKE